MLELLLIYALCTAIYRGHIARQRIATGSAVAALYVLTLDTANVIAAGFHDLHPLHAFIFMILGAGMWHRRGVSVLPAAELFAWAPWFARSVRVVVCAAVAWHCARKAARLGPLVPEHEPLGWVAEPFYGAAVCDALELLLYGLGRA